MNALDAIRTEIIRSETRARRLRAALRTLQRLFAKTRRRERDALAYEEAVETLREYDMLIPLEWRTFVW